MNSPGPARSTTGEREAWESAARACYQEIGVPFPERVVWVSSPLVGAFAAPIAACLGTGHRNHRVLDSVYRAVDATAGEAIGNAVRAAVQAAVDGAVNDPVHGAAATALHAEIAGAMSRALTSVVRDAPARDENRILSTSPLATLAGASDEAVRAAVDAAVGGPRQDTIRGEVRRLWRAHLGFQRSGTWLNLVGQFLQATASPTNEETGEKPGEKPLWQALAEQAPAGWWWWPFRDFVLLCPRPSEIHLAQVGEGARAVHRPHRADGPTAVWDDGFGLYFWHGTHVTQAVIDDTLTADEILRETNAEIRRCAIERRGWDRFIAEAGLEQIGPDVPDPGNPGQSLTLHDVPDGIYTAHVRVLLCTNGTVERDGTRRRFGLTVPAGCADPLEAAAWTYGLTSAQYATAQRRS
ncbi:hypothetical protein SAMN05444920_15016 [Nonomuraea solani]|uniref:DUF6745 domain-containing protein n=1 Tax=Nonomuraea solani TaxID=1144553 RepID=A0A1H6F3L3_9ACTN|nr:hypothetical protein [Nonomuraea solani]SEH03971.1 hypothetical protein SAMN05444920_15016 [Nonomuraea solani]